MMASFERERGEQRRGGRGGRDERRVSDEAKATILY